MDRNVVELIDRAVICDRETTGCTRVTDGIWSCWPPRRGKRNPRGCDRGMGGLINSSHLSNGHGALSPPGGAISRASARHCGHVTLAHDVPAWHGRT